MEILEIQVFKILSRLPTVAMGPSSSKTHFAGIVTNLLTSDIAGDDYDFWDDLWKVSLTTEEIFELISVEGKKYYYTYN